MPNQPEDTMTLSELSLAERKVIFLMRSMVNEFEKIDIKRNKDGFSVVSTATTKEDFHE